MAKAARVRDLFTRTCTHATAISAATPFVDSGITPRAFCLAVLAGSAITLMTRMQNGTDAVPVRVFVSVFAAFILAGPGLAHSVLDSLLIFCALHTGHAPFGYLSWPGWTALGNMVGGIGLVTLLCLIRSRELLARPPRQPQGA